MNDNRDCIHIACYVNARSVIIHLNIKKLVSVKLVLQVFFQLTLLFQFRY